MNVIRSILAAIVAFTLFTLAVPFVIITVVLSFGTLQNFVVENFGKIIGRSTLATAGIRFKIHQIGEPVNRPVIYTINHSSTLDLFVIIGLGLPRVRFVAKHEFQYNPVFFLLGNVTGQVFINRQNSEKAVENIQKAYNKILKRRLSVLVAPEGSRRHKGFIGTFKKGAFRMAIDLKYPIVPVYVDHAEQLSSGKSLITNSGDLNVYIHPAIDTTDWSLKTLDQHIGDVRSKYLEWAGISE